MNDSTTNSADDAAPKDPFGRAHGKFKLLYPSGKPKAEGRYYCGEPMGRWISYYEDGQVKSELDYPLRGTDLFVERFLINPFIAVFGAGAGLVALVVGAGSVLFGLAQVAFSLAAVALCVLVPLSLYQGCIAPKIAQQSNISTSCNTR